MSFTACATRIGSAQSKGEGMPVFTSQKPQLRVQVSPMMRKVAVPRPQHSAMFGQLASSQMVCSDLLRINRLRS